MSPAIKSISLFAALLISSLLLSCRSSEHSKSGVEKALQHYDQLILKLDADSIAWLYTPDGRMGEMAKGRDSIKVFLSSFQNIKVLSQHSTSDTVNITADTAIQQGIYLQSDVISGRDTVRVKGAYSAVWQWMDDGWHIRQMETKPLDMKMK